MSKDLLEKLLNGEIKAGSELNIRNENRQTRNFVKKINKLKRENGKISRLLILKEVALPFDALTGSQENFNDNYKWRLAVGQKDVMLAIKKSANENEKLKQIYMTKARVSEWNTEDVNNLTEADMKIFRPHTVMETFTFPCVHVNIPIFTGGQYGADYHIDVKRDEITGEIIGEVPAPLVINKFFRDMAFEEVQALRTANANSRNPLNEKDLKEKTSSIFKKNPVSDEIRKNFFIAVEVPLNSRRKFEDGYSLKGVTPADIEKMLVLIPKNGDIVKAMSDYFDGTREEFDVHPDFWELDMKCPASSSDQLDLANNTAYDLSFVQRVEQVDGFEDFVKALAQFRDESSENLEKIVTASVRLRKLTSADEENLIEASGSLIDTDSEFLTKKVIVANSNYLQLALGDKGDALLCQAEMGMTAEGQLDEAQAKKESKEYDVSAMMNNFGDGDDIIDDDDDVIE